MSKKLFRDQFAISMIGAFVKDRSYESIEASELVNTSFEIANLTVERIEQSFEDCDDDDCENCKEEADTKVDVGDLVAAIIADFKRTTGK